LGGFCTTSQSLQGDQTLGWFFDLLYNGHSQKGLLAYADSDWMADQATRWSVTGYFFKIANGIFSWQSQAQKTVAQSSTEAEYMALSHCS
jgi:hypothetical protein